MRICLFHKVKGIGMAVAAASCFLVDASQVRADRVDLNLFSISSGTNLGSGVDYWVDVPENAARDRHEFVIHVKDLANEGQLAGASGVTSSIAPVSLPASFAASAGLLLLCCLAAAGCRLRKQT